MEKTAESTMEKTERNELVGIEDVLRTELQGELSETPFGTSKKASKKKASASKTLNTEPLFASRKAKQVKLERYFTTEGKNPMEGVPYVHSNSKIKDTDGRTVFEMKNVEVPAAW